MRLFKGKIDVQRAFDTVSDGVDDIFYTKQESVDDVKELTEQQIKIADKATEFYGSTLQENTVRSKSRRSVAKSIVYSMLIIIFIYIVAGFFDCDSSHIKEIIFNSPLSTGFIMVLTFFFSGYYLNKMGIDPSVLLEKFKRRKRKEKVD